MGKASVESTNIVKMKVNDMVDLIVPLVVGAKRGKDLPGLNLTGAPGIGKSDGIREIGKRVAEATGKKVIVTDLRLLNLTPVDLIGIPAKDEQITTIIDENGKEKEIKELVARWLKPSVFAMSHSKDTINILFLDEITAAPPSVQAAAYQLVLDRKVGEHKLPENCFVMCAGNRVTDKSVAYKMPKALANRMVHMEIVADVDDWKKWAISSGIDHRIIGYINYQNTALFNFDPSSDDLAYATPRSWAMVDKFLKVFADLEKAMPLICGSIGVGAATSFKGYVKVYANLPNVEDIFNGKAVKISKSPDINFALCSAIVNFIPKATNAQLENMLKFTMSDDFSPEYATLIIKDIGGAFPEILKKFTKLPAWIEWTKKFRGLVM